MIAGTVSSFSSFVFTAETTYSPTVSKESVALPSASVLISVSSPFTVIVASSHAENTVFQFSSYPDCSRVSSIFSLIKVSVADLSKRV